jgi:hypothetical protein
MDDKGMFFEDGFTIIIITSNIGLIFCWKLDIFIFLSMNSAKYGGWVSVDFCR